MDALGLVLVGGGDDLDDLVARELEDGNLHGADVHQVGVEHAQDALVRDDQQVVLLALQLQDDGLQPHRQVVVRLRPRVPVVVRVQLVLLDLLRVQAPDRALAQLLAHPRVDLRHLRALPHLVLVLLEGVGRLQRAQPGRAPYRERAQGEVRCPPSDKRGSLLLPVLGQGIGHQLGIIMPFARQRRICPVALLLGCGAGADEERGTGLDVGVGQVEHNAMGEIVEGDIVVEELLSCVDHLDVVELILVHSLEHGDPLFYALEVQLGCLVGIHTSKLLLFS